MIWGLMRMTYKDVYDKAYIEEMEKKVKQKAIQDVKIKAEKEFNKEPIGRGIGKKIIKGIKWIIKVSK